VVETRAYKAQDLELPEIFKDRPSDKSPRQKVLGPKSRPATPHFQAKQSVLADNSICVFLRVSDSHGLSELLIPHGRRLEPHEMQELLEEVTRLVIRRIDLASFRDKV
jgi:hypothetical protein